MNPLKVLVIDDDLAMRESLELILSMEGFEVVTAECGVDAIALTHHHQFDVALTDLRMPGLSGLETIIALKKSDPRLPVIVVSAYVSDGHASECLSRGAFDVLRKPFLIKDLLSTVRRAIEFAGRKNAGPTLP